MTKSALKTIPVVFRNVPQLAKSLILPMFASSFDRDRTAFVFAPGRGAGSLGDGLTRATQLHQLQPRPSASRALLHATLSALFPRLPCVLYHMIFKTSRCAPKTLSIVLSLQSCALPCTSLWRRCSKSILNTVSTMRRRLEKKFLPTMQHTAATAKFLSRLAPLPHCGPIHWSTLKR